MAQLKKFVVYKLLVGEMIYIGSTYELKKRVGEHKSNCFNSNNREYNKSLYKYIRDNNIDFDDIEIEVLEDVENLFLTNQENEIQARKREQYYINDQDEITGENILNDHRAYITEEQNKERIKEYNAQYRQNNKERIKESNAQYYQQNKETIKEKRSQKFDCDCGGKYTRNHKVRHFKTQKHQAYISNLNK
jgi:NADH pyrophosphatase NudC (nudix superfamily)